MKKDSHILVLGGSGLVGSAVVRELRKRGHTRIVAPSHRNCDLMDTTSVRYLFEEVVPEYVFLCAARVGGIHANMTYPVNFFINNVKIGMNVLECAKDYKAKVMNLGSTCIYPKECPQPIKEEYLLSGKLEPSNEAYAVAKISILKLCGYYNTQYGCNFLSVMPTNIYGIDDNYHLENSHVLPAIIRKVITAKMNKESSISVWGDGTPVREFIFSDDVAAALVFLMDKYNGTDGIVNIGTGMGITIKEAYETAMKVFDYEVPLVFDPTKPNGTPVKISDVTKLNKMGFVAKTTLEEGMGFVYEDLKRKKFKWLEK